MKKTKALVLSTKEISVGIFEMWLGTDLAKEAKAGQFLSLYCKDGAHLLPRPISICEIDKENEELRLVYRVAGYGTNEFSKLKEGDSVEVLGCLGNGFPVDKAEGKTAFLIGGGIGVPPILQLAKENKGDSIILAGYRNSDTFLVEDFSKYGQLFIASEDGSIGTKGNVMDAIRENNLKADIIFACGPLPMLRAIKKYAEDNNVEAYISMEERMACGVGACLGCVTKTVNKDHHSHVNNTRICTEGPVFDAREVEI